MPHTAALHLNPPLSTHPIPPSPLLPCRYLPLTMEAEFQDHLGEVLPLILDGLSDEVCVCWGGGGNAFEFYLAWLCVCVHPSVLL